MGGKQLQIYCEKKTKCERNGTACKKSEERAEVRMKRKYREHVKRLFRRRENLLVGV